MAKFVFFTGGVVSSIGKGVTAASLSAVFKASGLSVAIAKLDPYINIDPGTMNPNQHGEVFVTEDGAETDLDLGHYERFLNCRMGRDNCCTAGQIYNTVIGRERAGDYLGATVQVIPHITDEIKKFISAVAKGADVAVIEVGGTVGDIESLPFLEAVRQMHLELPERSTCSVHVTLVPYIETAGELKTKPTQHSVRELREIGLNADVLLCRTASEELSAQHIRKIALFANVAKDNVFGIPDVRRIYELPIMLADKGVDRKICQKLGLNPPRPDLASWYDLLGKERNFECNVRIGFVGKYSNPSESYKSLREALIHAGWHTGINVQMRDIDAESLENGGLGALDEVDSVLVPGAFGTRGSAGKMLAIGAARERGIPYLGICAGMQLAIVEFARNCARLPAADSTELDSSTPHPVIHLDSLRGGMMGGTMRLGAETCELTPGTRLRGIYGRDSIAERHRHRYEFNLRYRALLETAGMVFSAWSNNGSYCEAVELPDHPWYVACQFHPEYGSTPMLSHPLFKSFVQAAAAAGRR